MSAVQAADGTVLDPLLLGRVRARLLAETSQDHLGLVSAGRVAAALRAEGRVLGDHTVLAVVGALRDELVGAGPLAGLLAEPGVTDVLVNGPDEVWVDRGQGLERATARLTGDDAVRRLAQRLASAAGRRLDDAAPWCDVRLPDGVRLHAVLSPVARSGTAISLRVPARRAWTLAELIDVGTVDDAGARLLRNIVEAKLSFLVTGGTGCGKTTVLGTLLGLVPARERIVVVEDLPELSPDHPHVVALAGRPPNVEGAGEVTLRDLVRQALRMRPDRLVVGECRGAEVSDLLAALNTGHEGGCGTVHANSAADVPARIEALAVGAGLSREAVHSQLAAALDVVLHLGRTSSGRRVLDGVAILGRADDGLVRAVPALVRDAAGEGALLPAGGHDDLLARLRRGQPRAGESVSR